MPTETTPTDRTQSIFRELKLGEVRLNERDRTVIKDGESAPLTDLSWRFLRTLIDEAPAPASVATLCQQVWGTPNVSPDTIAQRVRQVRRALGDDPKSPRYIRSIRGGGYQLIPAVETLRGTRTPPSAYQRPQWLLPAITIMGLLGVIGAVVVLNDRHSAPVLPSANPQVAELVHRGDEYRQRRTFADNQIAIGLYEQALAQAPDQIDALVGLSFSLSNKPSKYEQDPAFAEQAAKLADRALVLDPSRSDAWAARGLADDARGRVDSALDYYQRALVLSPGQESLIGSIAYLMQVKGQLHESLAMAIKALSLAPPTYFADIQIAATLRLAGLDAAGSAWLDRAIKLRPDNMFLIAYRARVLISQGDLEQTFTILDSAPYPRATHDFLRGLALLKSGDEIKATAAFQVGQARAHGRGRSCLYCIALLVSGGDSQAVTLVPSHPGASDKAIFDDDQWPEYRVELATLSASLGDNSRAIVHLRDAVSLGFLDTQWLLDLPPLSALMSSPQGVELLADMHRQRHEQRVLIKANPQLRGLLDNKS